MCDEARGCRSGTLERVIFAEYVRFNRAIVTKNPNTIVVFIAFPEFTPAKNKRE